MLKGFREFIMKGNVLDLAVAVIIGAAFARLCGERLFPVWRWLALAAAAVFLVLVILGPRLGDPNAVVDL